MLKLCASPILKACSISIRGRGGGRGRGEGGGEGGREGGKRTGNEGGMKRGHATVTAIFQGSVHVAL